MRLEKMTSSFCQLHSFRVPRLSKLLVYFHDYVDFNCHYCFIKYLQTYRRQGVSALHNISTFRNLSTSLTGWPQILTKIIFLRLYLLKEFGVSSCGKMPRLVITALFVI